MAIEGEIPVEERLIQLLDISRYLLGEARALAKREGLEASIAFREGNAEALPFSDNSFDVTMACTVLEEGDADRMLAELVRVTRPGGRVAVIVRTIDMPWWVNAPLDSELKIKVEAPSIHKGSRRAAVQTPPFTGGVERRGSPS